MSDFIPDSSFKPDAQAPQSTDGIIPDDQFQADEDNPIETAKAGIEDLERKLSFGFSDVARTKGEGYLPSSLQTTAQDLSQRIEQHPIASTVGGILGGAGALLATGGLTGALPAGAGIAARLGAHAAEGALFGVGNAVTDYALGDPELNAQKIASEVGFGALLGGSMGALGEGLKASIPFFKEKALNIASVFRRSPGAADTAAEIIGRTSEPMPEQAGVQPTSIDELIQKDKDLGSFAPGMNEPAIKQNVIDAANRVPLSEPLNPVQVDALGDINKYRDYKIMLEGDNDAAKAFRNLELRQKLELTNKTDSAIDSLAPGKEVTSDATEGGNQAIDYFTDQYKGEKERLGPAFEALKNTDIGDQYHLPNVVKSFSDSVPGVANMFDTAAGGELNVLPYKTKMGIDRATYNAVSDAVDSLKENPKNFKELADIRKGLDQNIDVTSQGQAPQEIRSLKASMLNYMQDVLDRGNNSLELRNIYKDYAINEQEREVIEKAFGASVGSKEFKLKSKVNPEDVIGKMFKDTSTIQAAKKILPEDQFNHMAANWLSQERLKASDLEKGTFSSNKFATFLKNKTPELMEVFKDNPEKLQYLRDVTTIAKAVPDSVRANPSGTASTLVGLLKNTHGLGVGDLAALAVKSVKHMTVDKIEEAVANNRLNEALAGQAAKADVLSTMGDMIQKTTDKIDTGARSIFNSVGKATILRNKPPVNFEKAVKKLDEFSQNPGDSMGNLAYNTDHLHFAAPNITQGIHNSVARAAQFLSSKIPRPVNELALSQSWEPSQAQKAQFSRYYNTVEDPISALKEVKNGDLSNETMEALNAVHPNLLEEMQKKVMENINPKTAKNLPYSTKISISKFVGQPLENSLMPGVILANQTAFAAPSPQDQQQAKFSKSQESKSKHASSYATATQSSGEDEA